jgi:hypothetical protein
MSIYGSAPKVLESSTAVYWGHSRMEKMGSYFSGHDTTHMHGGMEYVCAKDCMDGEDRSSEI